ncbi:MAG: aldose 1-epimerase family protein [Rubrobacter sp.]
MTVNLFGTPLTQRELRRRVGRLDQAAGIEPFVFGDGPARGVRILRFRTGSGLAFDVLVDRGMDLGAAEHGGTPLAWLSPTGVVKPSFHEPEDEGWLRSFHGGLLVTCGLQNVGPPDEHQGEKLGLHGRASNIPASRVSHDALWDESGCVLEAWGQIRESRVFGPNLVLRRSISARVGESRIRIEDEVRNEGFEPEPLLVLYHMNLGWPLLDETSRLTGPGGSGPPEPRDHEAQEGLSAWDRFQAPTPGFGERVFYHRPVARSDGWAEARLENPELASGLALSVRFRPEELPEFVQWTMTGEGVYVLGLEPATCRVEGRAAEEAAGRVIRLEPGESRRHGLEIEASHLRA